MALDMRGAALGSSAVTFACVGSCNLKHWAMGIVLRDVICVLVVAVHDGWPLPLGFEVVACPTLDPRD